MLIAPGRIAHIVLAFNGDGWKDVLPLFLGGVFYLLAGALIFVNPILASSLLTLMIAASLLAVGGRCAHLVRFKTRPEKSWGWMAVAGAAALLLGFIIALGWPVNSLFIIGMFLEVDLLMQGWSYIALGLALRWGSAADRGPCRQSAPRQIASPRHDRHSADDGRGSEVSRGRLFQQKLFQCQIQHRLAQAVVLFLEIL